MAGEVSGTGSQSRVSLHLGVVSVLLAVVGGVCAGLVAAFNRFDYVDRLAQLGGIAFLVLELAALGAALLGAIRIRNRASPLGERVLLILGCGLSLVLLVVTVEPVWRWPRFVAKTRVTACRRNLSRLGDAMTSYCQRHDGKYPTPEKWCDLLFLEPGKLPAVTFLCPNRMEGRCHYAMNPLADPRGAPDVVLLFESKGGWNQAGGPELLTTKHHGVCNVLLVDGTVATVGPDEIHSLKWKSEPRSAQDVQQSPTPAQ